MDARRARLERYDGQEPGLLRLLELPERPCLQLQEDVILEREIDFALKKLAHRHEEVIRALGTQWHGRGAGRIAARRGIYNHFCSVFYLGCRRREADGALPAGAYASVFYRGPYSQLADVCAALWPRLAAQGLRQDGPVMELYHIDAHDTARVDEYLTEVQVRVARCGAEREPGSMASEFTKRIYEVVRQIPRGCVASYGQVAFLAGIRAARGASASRCTAAPSRAASRATRGI